MSTINWKEAARWYRARFRSAMTGIDHRTRLAAAEHEKRVTLVNAMSALLPQIAIDDDWICPGWCHGCKRLPDVHGGHTDGCLYVQALRAITEAGHSVDVEV